MRRTWLSVAALTLGLTVSGGLTVSAAFDWRAEVVIAHSAGGAFSADASHRDRLSLIAWQVAGDPDGILRVAISRDAGRGDFATRRLADGVVGMAVAACGDEALVAYRQRRADGGLRLRLARIPGDAGAVERVTVRRSVPARGTVDLACGSHRATVAWTERLGATWHALVRHARLSDLGRTAVQDLGAAHRSRVAAAASGDRAYVAWSDASGLRLQRFVVGDGPRFPVAARALQRPATDGRGPMLAADGAHVALAFQSGAFAAIHTSRDGGRSFPDGTGLGVTPGDASPTSLALEQGRGVATLELAYDDHAPDFHRLSRSSPEGRWTGSSLAPKVVDPLDGFLVAGTGTKLAETYVRADDTMEGWELVFRRQR